MANIQIPQDYKTKIKNRTFFHFCKGIFPRVLKYIKFAFFRFVARRKGAIVGANTNLNWHLVKNVNSNLVVGDDCIIESAKLDLRGGRIVIDDHVIINKDVQIIRLSHFIDNDCQFSTRYYPDLHISSFSWIATAAKILPQVTFIGEGVVCGAFSVIAKNCEEDTIYAGNPAKPIRTHNTRFKDLVVCSLQSGDLKYYIKSRFE